MDSLSEMLKGVLEGMILQIIDEGEVYGYEVVRRLTGMGFAGMTEGTVYTIFIRLEKNKLVQVTKKPSQLGPPRKFYRLNEKGVKELAAFWKKWTFLSDRVEALRNGGIENGNQS